MSGAGAICTITQSDDDERSRALNLVAAFWPELQPMVRRWLGTAFDEDDGRVGEVVFLMVRRISGGKGIVPPLRGIRSGDPGVKGLVFANARFVTAEVVRSARGHRRWRSTLTDFAALEIPAPGGLEDVLLDGSIASLLELGDETWKQLCAAGVLDPSDWTEDEKWTAIGMMWDLSARDIATVRYVMAGAPSVVLDDGCRSTYQKVRTVHSKGQAPPCDDVGGTAPCVRVAAALRPGRRDHTGGSPSPRERLNRATSSWRHFTAATVDLTPPAGADRGRWPRPDLRRRRIAARAI